MSQVQAEAWATGRHEVFVQAQDFNFANCGANLGLHGGFTRKSRTAGTFKAGADLKKVIGIDLSAQSGYNKNVLITYKESSFGRVHVRHQRPPERREL